MNIYRKILDSFNVAKGDRIWLSSELARLTIQLRRDGIEFDPGNLINAFQERLGDTGTLIIPNFLLNSVTTDSMTSETLMSHWSLRQHCHAKE